MDDLGKTRDQDELYWAILRYITDKTFRGMSCQQMLTITFATGSILQESNPHRIDVCRDEILERLRKLEGEQKMTDNRYRTIFR